MSVKLSDYDFSYPESAVALRPAEQRDASALFVLNRKDGVLTKACFSDLPQYLQTGDVLVRNTTRVVPVRFQARRKGGGVSEVFVIGNAQGDPVCLADGDLRGNPCLLMAMISRGKRVSEGSVLALSDDVEIHVQKNLGAGRWLIQVQGVTSPVQNVENIFVTLGRMPVPPYLRDKHQSEDPQLESENFSRYQTTFAKTEGSIAAPTAGLHFTPAVDASLRAKGIEILEVVLHVSMGTFQPIRDEDVRLHKMEAEYFSIPPETREHLRTARQQGRRIIAVGSTVTRTLETLIRRDPNLNQIKSGWTDLFIHGDFSFQCVTGLITNFHLPKSSLLLMVSAFAGRERILHAYELAIAQGARLFSYGDAMLLI